LLVVNVNESILKIYLPSSYFYMEWKFQRKLRKCSSENI